MRKTLSFALSLFLIFGCLGFPAFAAEEAQVAFIAGKPDANGYFTVTMTMSDATFNAFQFALRYDPSVIEPVDDSGGRAKSFFDFAAKEAPWLSTIGCSADADTGFVGFTGYVSPGESASVITNGEAFLGATPTAMFSFRFKVLKTGDPAMRIATKEQGEPYEHAFPQGSGIMGRAGESPVKLTFDMSALEGGKTAVETPTVSASQPPVLTAEQLLKQCLILKIGSHALVAEGGVTAFYPDEPDVVPFIDATDRTYVPLRFVAERLGADVEWVNESQGVRITQGDTVVFMTIGATEYTINGQTRAMDATPKLVPSKPGEARTMVPIRFVAEGLGKTVGWDSENSFVIITSGDRTWDSEGETERETLTQANALLLMYGGFV